MPKCRRLIRSTCLAGNPCRELREKRSQETPSGIINQTTGSVELLVGPADKYLGLKHDGSVGQDECLTQLRLRPRRARETSGSAHDSDRLALQDTAAQRL